MCVDICVFYIGHNRVSVGACECVRVSVIGVRYRYVSTRAQCPDEGKGLTSVTSRGLQVHVSLCLFLAC